MLALVVAVTTDPTHLHKHIASWLLLVSALVSGCLGVEHALHRLDDACVPVAAVLALLLVISEASSFGAEAAEAKASQMSSVSVRQSSLCSLH